MRGKGLADETREYRTRITPAYAGKRPESLFDFGSNRGSPPPMRGKDGKIVQTSRSSGITPAYAGKSSIVSPSSAVDWDHPRLCGEKIASHCTVTTWSGSPPPMRGKAVQTTWFPSKYGITPAYAGKRMRDSRFSLTRSGSPPPMRGKGRRSFFYRDFHRITPAYAGKSSA